MIIRLADLREKYHLEVSGVVHVGAHLGQEYGDYRKQFGDGPITWVEADPLVHDQLALTMQHDAAVLCLNAVVSDRRQQVSFHRANNGYSSSMLELGTHRTVHPDVEFVDEFTATTVTLDELAEANELWNANFLSIDVQGAEGLVIRGAKRFLKGVDYIYTEVNRDELYIGCTRLVEFDNLLVGLGFSRVELALDSDLGWGEAFYVKRHGFENLRLRFRSWLDRLFTGASADGGAN